ncbi:MAG TPA: DUF499 domain-containing protein [Nitrolancea sp.]|nr:DUF499 domain-containing protein [Nitrolancea sp.]
MPNMKPWHTVVTPREDLREKRPLDAAEFAVHLGLVREGTAPKVYQQPQEFFERTFLTANLTALAAEVARRLSGIATETSAVFNLATQFGGGKTHALTLLYHLAHNGVDRGTDWPGVGSILARAGVASIPRAAVATFVGTEFDSLDGRGGGDGSPHRVTPWGEIAYQLGGAEAFAHVAEHDRQRIAPGGDVLRKILPTERPTLILMDELLNYAARWRREGVVSQLYPFLQNLSETARSLPNVVLAVSIPASELEMTPEDHADHERFKKLLDRLGKAYLLSAETETSEIIRRRLFEWDLRTLGQNGRVNLPREARATCDDYALWVLDHRQQLPQWFPLDRAAEAFAATYPFHPSVLSVFERKWQTLPRFQRTRGVLRLLALWVSHAYDDGYRKAHRDPLIGLGTAPLEDPLFRAAVFEQLGESRLEPVVTTDICGKPGAHAVRLDEEAPELLRKSRLHQKVATAIFFESHGGSAGSQPGASLPETRLAVAEPGLDLGNVETALDALVAATYYLRAEGTLYRFGLTPNLNKLLADRRATIQQVAIAERVRREIEAVFKAGSGAERVFFPDKSNDIPDRPALTLAILAPDTLTLAEPDARERLLALTREYGASARQFKNALIWCVAESSAALDEEARKVLAWESLDRDPHALGDDPNERQRLGHELSEGLGRAKRDLQNANWRAYRRLLILDKANGLKDLDLGQLNASGGALVTQILAQLQQRDELTDGVGPAYLGRNWPPALPEWSTRAVRDAFYASPLFPRLSRADVVKETIAKGVSEGVLAYVGAKSPSGEYRPFRFNEPLSPTDVDLSADMFIIPAEAANAYLQAQSARTAQEAAEPTPVPVPVPIPAGASANDSGIAIGADGQPAQEGTASFIYPRIGAQGGNPGVRDSRTLSWAGEIPPQKWTLFYTKVVSSLVNAGELSLHLTLTVRLGDGASQQRIEALKAALRELGLSDTLDMS